MPSNSSLDFLPRNVEFWLDDPGHDATPENTQRCHHDRDECSNPPLHAYELLDRQLRETLVIQHELHAALVDGITFSSCP